MRSLNALFVRRSSSPPHKAHRRKREVGIITRPLQDSQRLHRGRKEVGGSFQHHSFGVVKICGEKKETDNATNSFSSVTPAGGFELNFYSFQIWGRFTKIVSDRNAVMIRSMAGDHCVWAIRWKKMNRKVKRKIFLPID